VDVLFYLVDLAVLSGVPFRIVFKLLVLKLPAIMVLFFPMSVLFATMLLLVRMAKDNELTILRTSGIQTIRILTPLLIAAFLAATLSYITNEKIVPWSSHASEVVLREQIQHTPPPEIVENVVFREGDRFFYIQKVDAKHNRLNTVLIFEKKAEFPRFVSAQWASWQGQTWTLNNGYIQDLNSDGSIQFSDHFDQFLIHVNQDLVSFYSPPRSAREMDSKELKDRMKNLANSGLSVKSLLVEYHMKKSIPVACVIFSLIGISFCMSFVRSGKDWWGVIWAICLAVLAVGLYFFMVALCRAFGKDGHLPPLLGAWLPNLTYGLIGIGIISYRSMKT
jgi:lipopolysaccharide export system permease protein